MKHTEADDFKRVVDLVIKDGFKKVVVDIAQVDWMNSTGLAMLVRGYVTLNGVNIPMRIAGASAAVENIMTINKLDKIFGLHKTVAEAIHSLK
jgi:anti-anti-sigma factor